MSFFKAKVRVCVSHYQYVSLLLTAYSIGFSFIWSTLLNLQQNLRTVDATFLKAAARTCNYIVKDHVSTVTRLQSKSEICFKRTTSFYKYSTNVTSQRLY